MEKSVSSWYINNRCHITQKWPYNMGEKPSPDHPGLPHKPGAKLDFLYSFLFFYFFFIYLFQIFSIVYKIPKLFP